MHAVRAPRGPDSGVPPARHSATAPKKGAPANVKFDDLPSRHELVETEFAMSRNGDSPFFSLWGDHYPAKVGKGVLEKLAPERTRTRRGRRDT